LGDQDIQTGLFDRLENGRLPKPMLSPDGWFFTLNRVVKDEILKQSPNNGLASTIIFQSKPELANWPN
jgi:hypothetical protein